MSDLALVLLAAVEVSLRVSFAVLEDLSLFRDVFIGAGTGAIVGADRRLARARRRPTARRLAQTPARGPLDRPGRQCGASALHRRRATMSAVARTLLTVLALVCLSVTAGLIGEALEFNGVAYFAALLVVMVLASLTDRERFYGSPGRSRPH